MSFNMWVISVKSLWSNQLNLFCSMNHIVDLHLTLQKSIGTPDYILSTIGLSNNSSLKTLSPMCLQE